ncbi:chloride channel protein [Gleimia hominis]|uniref:chloride channel protein n=1 Tax=Gleimia hominis TaxID=595468 RepID=UPI001E51F924|nr:chloride channel protein [Gleimia hominis]WIK65140.1 chloride channel protein [Gleimia hominis]
MKAFARAVRGLVAGHRSAFALATAFVGLVVGLAAVAFNLSIEGWSFLMTGAFDYTVHPWAPHAQLHIGRWFLIFVPVISALIYGPMIAKWAPTAKGHGIPEVMLAVRRRGGRIPGTVAIVKILSSALTIGGGGSAGREGPIVQVGASLGSRIGRLAQLPTNRIIILTACGSAAGIAATFHAPLAGAIFALEVILVQFTAETFGYVVISAVVASIVARSVYGTVPLIDLSTTLDLGSQINLVLVAVVGLVAGLVGMSFSKILYAVEDGLDWVWAHITRYVPLPGWSRAAVFALPLGVGLVFFPYMYGSGYPIQLSGLMGQYSIWFLLVLALARILFTAHTIGMGGSGGVFAPTLFIGAMVGTAFGQVVSPYTDTSPAMFGVIGMGAAFAGAARAPLTAVLIIVEMTSQFSLILPMMLAVVIATGASRFFTRATIYTEKLRRRGDILDDPASHTLLGVQPAAKIMTAPPAVLKCDDTITRAVSLMREEHVQALPVTDGEGRFLGVVTALDATSWRQSGHSPEARVDALELHPSSVPTTALPSSILQAITQSGVSAVAVISAAGHALEVDDSTGQVQPVATGEPDHPEGHLVGWIGGRDLVDRLYREQRRAVAARNEPSSWGSRWRSRRLARQRQRQRDNGLQ